MTGKTKCENCGGRGTHPLRNGCPECGGTGWIPASGVEAHLRRRLREVEAELKENEGVIKVWRRRCEEAEARLDAHRAEKEKKSMPRKKHGVDALYRGIHADRYTREPLEKRFAKKWQETNKLAGAPTHLGHLLGDGTGKGPATWVTERDHLVAATVIQWLGSNVGQSFLSDVLKIDLTKHPVSENPGTRTYEA